MSSVAIRTTGKGLRRIRNLDFSHESQALSRSTMSKRTASPPPGGALVKRARSNEPPTTQIAISSTDERQKGLIRTVKRTSNLDAPIISLSGAHSVSIKSCMDVIIED